MRFAFMHLIGLARSAHVAIDSQAESREARASKRRSLRPGRRSQRASRDAPSQHAVRQIVLGPVALDAALGAREDGADLAEVARRRVGARAHVAQAASQLFAER